MMLILNFILSQILQELANKPLKIFISGYSDYFLGRNLKFFGDCPFEQNILGNVGFESDCKINEDGDFFTIKIGGRYLCETNRKIIPCKNKHPDLWTITPVSFGYNFKRRGLCLTFSNRALNLSTCDNKVNQVFDFLEIPEILMCDKFDLDIPPEIIKQIVEKGDKYVEILKEKTPPKTFKEFVDRNFKKKDKDKAKKTLGSLWSFRNPFGNKKWKLGNLLKYLCPPM